MVAVFDHGDIDIDNITILKHFIRWNAVADYVVNGGADGLWEAVIIEWRGHSVLHIDDIVMADLIQFVGGHAGFDVFTNHGQYFTGQFAGESHFFNFFSGFDCNRHVCP